MEKRLEQTMKQVLFGLSCTCLPVFSKKRYIKVEQLRRELYQETKKKSDAQAELTNVAKKLAGLTSNERYLVEVRF